jgi:hypothetical protein
MLTYRQAVILSNPPFAQTVQATSFVGTVLFWQLGGIGE